MIARNPAEHVSIARSPVAKIDDSLTAEEAAAVLAAAKGDELEALVWLATKYGMRLGELLGIDHRCRGCGDDQACSSAVRRFHASRHTAATLLLEAGVALEVVSAILGLRRSATQNR
jgi:integrase